MDVTSYMLGKKNGGTTPTGTISITENGEHNVTSYATANVSVDPDLESKSVTITENTTTTITPTQGKDGLSSVSVTTNVSVSVDTYDKLKSSLENYRVNVANKANSYETLTQNATTLYTPKNTNTFYVIFKDNNEKYKIAWLSSESYSPYELIGVCPSGTSPSYYYVKGCHLTFEYQASAVLTGFKYVVDTGHYYSNNTYNTLEDCLIAIQSNQTQYTYGTANSNFRLYDENSIVLSNYCIMNMANNNFINSKRISQNETIQAIS